jgi:MoxR-like ATPase
VNTLSKILGLKFNRIQFTPDLMPSDIIGSEILDKDKQFKFVDGPVFCNVLLADEINRTPPKTQSALLEAMQEKTITVSGKKKELPNPFFVLATQNPIEQEGTYPLPEAQLDRFMFSINLSYPSVEDEINIVKKTTIKSAQKVKTVFDVSDIINYQKLLLEIPVNDNVIKYAVGLVHKTRPNQENSSDFINNYVSFGAGPRASQFLIMGAKINSILDGKFSPDIEDVKKVSSWVLSHRIVKNYKAESEGISVDDIINKLI